METIYTDALPEGVTLELDGTIFIGTKKGSQLRAM
jgi:hypothetical protein